MKLKEWFWEKCTSTHIWVKSIPTKVTSWFVNFGWAIVDSFKMLPKVIKYSYRNMKDKFINIPQSTKKFFLKVKGYQLMDYKRIVYNNAIFVVLVGLVIYIIIRNNTFINAENITSIINQSGVRLLVALGAGTIIVARGTDLSAGRTVGVTAFVGAIFSQKIVGAFDPKLAGTHPFLVVVIAMLVGASVGFMNGIIVAKFNVTPFIATLGSMLAVYGLNQWLYSKYTFNQPIGNIDSKYTDFSTKGLYLGTNSYISYIAIISLSIAFIMWIIWTKMPWGRKIFAVGGNPEAAAVSGISVPFILINTYVVGGMLYGIAGTFEAWNSGSTSTGTGNMYELDAIAAAIVGGLSFDGGKGKISGIIIGVFLFQTITYGFSYIGTSSAITYIIRGGIIVLAVAIDALKNKVRK